MHEAAVHCYDQVQPVTAAHAKTPWLIGLMQAIAPKLMAEDSANNFSQNSGSEENSPPVSASSTPTGAEAQTLEGPFRRVDVCETSHSVVELPEPEHTTQPNVQPTQADLQPAQPVLQPTQPVRQASLPVPHPPRVGLQCQMPAKPFLSCIMYFFDPWLCVGLSAYTETSLIQLSQIV